MAIDDYIYEQKGFILIYPEIQYTLTHRESAFIIKVCSFMMTIYQMFWDFQWMLNNS